MTQNEFRALPFAEARAKLLEEMGLPDDIHISDCVFINCKATPVSPQRWPLRFGREA